ncbi:MAG: c-type cytochrome [Chitinophagaceae bacterium]
MRKFTIILASCFLFACGSGDDKAKGEITTTAENKEEAKNADQPALPAGITQADYDKGLQLIAGDDCLTCHKVTELHTGPAYAEIAKKYEITDANIAMLADKIIKGGSGNWGTVPMTAHDSVSVDDAKTMVKYVLSLKNMK